MKHEWKSRSSIWSHQDIIVQYMYNFPNPGRLGPSTARDQELPVTQNIHTYCMQVLQSKHFVCQSIPLGLFGGAFSIEKPFFPTQDESQRCMVDGRAQISAIQISGVLLC